MSVPVRIVPLDALASHVGQELACSDWLLIDQSRIAAFAEATDDRQWIHLDAERARRESPFGTTIAHGYLTLSLIPGLLGSCLQVEGAAMVINYGLDRVRFPAAVPSGSRLRARVSLEALDAIEHGVQAHWQVTIEREGSDRPVCIARMLARYLQAVDGH